MSEQQNVPEMTNHDGVWAKWRERIQALKNVPAMLRMVWEAAPGITAAGLFFRLLAALIPLGLISVTAVIIQAIHRQLSGEGLLPHFWWYVAAEFALATVGTVLGRIVDYCDTVLADKFTRYISTRTMEHASRLDLASYEDPQFYDKLERARAQGTDRVMMIQMTGRLVQQVITAGSLAAGILYYSPWLLLGLIICVVPAFLGESHFAFLGYSLSFRQTPERRELDYLRVLGGSKESAKELKLFGLSTYLVNRYRRISDKLHKENVALANKRLLAGSFLTFLGTVGYYGAYVFVIYETVHGPLGFQKMTFLTGAIAGASSNIQAVFSTFSGIADQALFLTDLLEFFSVRPKVSSKANALAAPRPIQRGFEFRNVSFAYPGNERRVLDDVTFRLAPGERIALVGENGQGKTTIVKLLTRLYDPTEGQILLDGVDLREYDQESLWKEVGVIFQDFTRYEMSASDNIAVGQIGEQSNVFRIRSAAHKSLAEGVVRKLPKGYDQILGCRFEGGLDLSGGEWQKIALARAYLRDAQLLILDEPTAALDARSEREVFDRFAELTQGKMALLISHRFSTTRMVDRILVLEGGRIAEQGRYDQLVQSRGSRYAQMFELQAANYR